jgi:hypothetical protein
MPRASGGSYGGGRLLLGEVSLYPKIPLPEVVLRHSLGGDACMAAGLAVTKVSHSLEVSHL